MCIAYPYKIKSIDGKIAVAKAKKTEQKVKTDLVSGIKEGDWVLVNSGFAVSKISKKEALKMTNMLDDVRKAGDDNAC